MKKQGAAAMSAHERSGHIPGPKLAASPDSPASSGSPAPAGLAGRPWLVAFVISGLLSACLLAFEMNGLIPEVPIVSLDPPLFPGGRSGARISDTEREALLSALREVSERAQERQDLRQRFATSPFESGDLESTARNHHRIGEQDLQLLQKLDEDVRTRFPVESLTADDRRVVVWVRTLRFITLVDLMDFANALDRPLLGRGPTEPVSPTRVGSRLLGKTELKLFADCLDAMLEVLDPVAFSESTPPWIISYISMCFTVARTATGAAWDSSLVTLRSSRMEAFEKKLDGWSWDRGPGSALARLSWLAWRRGRGFVSPQELAVQRRMASESIVELRRHPGCDGNLIGNLEKFLFTP
jgi:hypothetical protein